MGFNLWAKNLTDKRHITGGFDTRVSA